MVNILQNTELEQMPLSQWKESLQVINQIQYKKPVLYYGKSDKCYAEKTGRVSLVGIVIRVTFSTFHLNTCK